MVSRGPYGPRRTHDVIPLLTDYGHRGGRRDVARTPKSVRIAASPSVLSSFPFTESGCWR